MSISTYCILIMILFPYVFTTIGKWSGRFDNHDPRAYFENSTGWRRRANYVQMNSFEIFPMFATGVILAMLAHVSQHTIDLYALTFVVSRILYGICYLADLATLRTLMWSIGIVVVIGLIISPIL